MGAGSHDRPASAGRVKWIAVWILFALLLTAFWAVAKRYGITRNLGGHLPVTVLSFALLLAPLWGFGFGLAAAFEPILRWPWLRRLLPGALVLPYFTFTYPRGQFSWTMGATFLVILLGVSGLLEWAAVLDACDSLKFRWQDGIALLLLGLPVEFHWFAQAFPGGGLGAFPKLLLLDAALYGFLVVRRVPDAGFDLRLRMRDLWIGVREWAMFAPVAIGFGLSTGFIHFHAHMPTPGHATSAVLVTFFLVALPEEFYFRGILQNLLASRMTTGNALWTSAALFGLSHFNKGMAFNTRYVVLAAVAGIFYGRAWRDRRRVAASALTHTMVDVAWSLWFR